MPITLARGSAICAGCGAETPLDAAYRAALREALGDFAKVARDELEARFAQAFYLQNEKAATRIVGGSVALAIFLTGMFVAWAITRQFGMGIPMVYFAILFVGWALSLLAFASGWDAMFDVPDVSELVRTTATVRCGRCGSVQAAIAGEAAPVCDHCRSDLLVPCALVADLVEGSRASAERALEGRHRSLARARSAGDRLVGASVVTVILVVFGGIGVVLAVGRPAGSEVPSTTAWLAFLGVFLVALASIVRSTRRGAKRREATDRAIAEVGQRVAEQLGLP